MGGGRGGLGGLGCGGSSGSLLFLLVVGVGLGVSLFPGAVAVAVRETAPDDDALRGLAQGEREGVVGVLRHRRRTDAVVDDVLGDLRRKERSDDFEEDMKRVLRRNLVDYGDDEWGGDWLTSLRRGRAKLRRGEGYLRRRPRHHKRHLHRHPRYHKKRQDDTHHLKALRRAVERAEVAEREATPPPPRPKVPREPPNSPYWRRAKDGKRVLWRHARLTPAERQATVSFLKVASPPPPDIVMSPQRFCKKAAPWFALDTCELTIDNYKVDVSPALANWVTYSVNNPLTWAIVSGTTPKTTGEVRGTIMEGKHLKTRALRGWPFQNYEPYHADDWSDMWKYIHDALTNTVAASCTHTITHSIGYNAFNMLTDTVTHSVTNTVGRTLPSTLLPLATRHWIKFSYRKWERCFFYIYRCHYIDHGHDCKIPDACLMYEYANADLGRGHESRKV